MQHTKEACRSRRPARRARAGRLLGDGQATTADAATPAPAHRPTATSRSTSRRGSPASRRSSDIWNDDEPRHPGRGADRAERQRRHVPELLQPARGRQRARPRSDRVRRPAELPRAGRPGEPRQRARRSSPPRTSSSPGPGGRSRSAHEDAVYGIPQDSGPMALFYRADLFEAERHRRADHVGGIRGRRGEGARRRRRTSPTSRRSTSTSSPDCVWQAGGHWFAERRQDEWTVDLADEASTKVADYWQDLLDRDLVSTVPGLDRPSGTTPTTPVQRLVLDSAVWGANSIASGAPDTVGQVGGRPAPQWGAGEQRAGNWGGSSIAVFKGTRAPLRGGEVRSVAEHLRGGAHRAEQVGEHLPRHDSRPRAACAQGGRRVLRRPEDLRRLRRGRRRRSTPTSSGDRPMTQTYARRVGRLQGGRVGRRNPARRARFGAGRHDRRAEGTVHPRGRRIVDHHLTGADLHGRHPWAGRRGSDAF